MEIQGNKVEGYLWYSDRDKPVVYDGVDLTLDLNDEDNPFIIEGQLYDRNSEKSYCIKYVDGRYFLKRYSADKIKSDSKCEVKDKYFQSHCMNEKVLHFKEVWEEEQDALCCGMEVLQPGKLVFVGFRK